MPLAQSLISYGAVPALAGSVLYFQYRNRDRYKHNPPIDPTLPSSTSLLTTPHSPTADIDAEQVCPFCREELAALVDKNIPILQLPRCTHIYCSPCLATLTSGSINSCPLCRSPFCNLSTLPVAFTTSVLRWNLCVFCSIIIAIYQPFMMLRFASNSDQLLRHPWILGMTIAFVMLYAILQLTDFVRGLLYRDKMPETWWQQVHETYETRPRIEKAWMGVSVVMALLIIVDMQLALWGWLNA